MKDWNNYEGFNLRIIVHIYEVLILQVIRTAYEGLKYLGRFGFKNRSMYV